jgi:hypothetical protein
LKRFAPDHSCTALATSPASRTPCAHVLTLSMRHARLCLQASRCRDSRQRADRRGVRDEVQGELSPLGRRLLDVTIQRRLDGRNQRRLDGRRCGRAATHITATAATTAATSTLAASTFAAPGTPPLVPPPSSPPPFSSPSGPRRRHHLTISFRRLWAPLPMSGPAGCVMMGWCCRVLDAAAPGGRCTRGVRCNERSLARDEHILKPLNLTHYNPHSGVMRLPHSAS